MNLNVTLSLLQRMTHKVGGMIVGTAGVMMFLEKFL
jgi:hypothetical protein